MEPTRGDSPWWQIPPLGVGRLLLPALSSAIVYALLFEGSPGVAFLSAAIAACLVAVVLVWLRESRVSRLRNWVSRVRRGESAVPPLARRAPDQIDRLAIDLSALTEEQGSQITRLEFERDRLEAVLAAMVEAVVVIDDSGTVLRANERVRETFEIPLDAALVGAKLWDLSRDFELNAAVRDALEGRGPSMREVELQGADSRFLRLTAGPTGDGSAWVVVMHDVTETKRLERVRTDFVANVSHELRTPLTAIKGFAENLASGGLGDRDVALRQVTIIDRQAERLSRLIGDLLVLSDLELGRIPIQAQETEVLQVVDEVLEMVNPIARRKGVALRTDVDRALVVYADPDRLVQVLSNLIDNGVKFTQQGGEVVVSARRSAEGGQVLIEVEDTGVGIPAEDLPRLAERFYRVDKARSREFGGTGLGLSIVKHICQAHGGDVSISSRLGSGTTVSVSFPEDEQGLRTE